MTADLPYPDEPAGPFPSPPATAEDREGRTVTVTGHVPGDAVPESLVEMYLDYDPADRAQGIPPGDEPGIRRWLDELFGSGYNVVAHHDDGTATEGSGHGPAVGHATLVPGDGDGAVPPHELAIFVASEYQGAGIGKRLIRHLLGHGADHGVEKVWLTVERWNRVAVGLYEDVGFEMADARSFEQEMALRVATDGA
jgi:GNAT superfamily N-acetyltransferase